MSCSAFWVTLLYSSKVKGHVLSEKNKGVRKWKYFDIVQGNKEGVNERIDRMEIEEDECDISFTESEMSNEEEFIPFSYIAI